MTRVKRPVKQQQRTTLIRLFVGLIGIGGFTIFLFQLDAFPKQKRREPKAPSLGAMTPDRLAETKTYFRKPDAIEKLSQALANEEEVSKDDDDALADKPASHSGKQFEMELSTASPDKSIGRVLFKTRPDWAPIGTEHFHKLVAAKFYDQCRFFRVLDNFMVQFGIAADPSVQQTWKHEILNEDPVLETNRRGTMTYATSGKNTRTTQLFINTNKKAEGNKFLDKQGFAPFAQVLEGMEFVDQINKEYGEKPVQGKIVRKGNEYLAEDFPRLSYIVSIREIVEQPKGMR